MECKFAKLLGHMCNGFCNVEIISSGPPDRSLSEILRDPPKLHLEAPKVMDKPRSEADSFFGIDLQTGDPRLTGATISGGCPITPEAIEECFRLLLERFGRAPCEGENGVLRHLFNPKGNPRYCVLCGWDPR